MMCMSMEYFQKSITLGEVNGCTDEWTLRNGNRSNSGQIITMTSSHNKMVEAC